MQDALSMASAAQRWPSTGSLDSPTIRGGHKPAVRDDTGSSSSLGVAGVPPGQLRSTRAGSGHWGSSIYDAVFAPGAQVHLSRLRILLVHPCSQIVAYS